MSKRTQKRSAKHASRYQYVGAAGVGGFRIAHPQRDSVVAVMVAEFGEERAEALLRGAEDGRVSFVTHLWNKKVLAPAALRELWQSVEKRAAQQEAEAAKAIESGEGRTLTPKILSPAEGEERRREWREAREEGRVISGPLLEPEFDPCFRPEAWPWEADAAKRREAAEKYAQERVAAALASAEGRQQVAYDSARAKNTIAAALSRLGIQEAAGADGRTFLCADLLEAPWERFGDVGRAFLSALLKEIRSNDRAGSLGATGAYLLLEGELRFAAAYSASRATPKAATGATETPVGGWHPNSAESDAGPPAQTVERESSVFPVEADFQFELRDAKDNAGTFERQRVEPAEKAAKAWKHEEDADALAGATLYFNLGTRLCALGTAKSDGAAIARAAESFRKAKEVAATAKKGDPTLAAKIQHSLGYALFTGAETTGELAGFQASAEASNEAAVLYAGTDDPKRCGHARFNLALALTAVANRTGRVSDFTNAAGAFAQAAEMYATSAEAQESASALHRQGLIQLELGRRTGDAAAFQKAAAASAEAAKRFVAVDDVRGSAAARDNQTIALTEGGDVEAAAAAAAEAAVRHAESGNTLGCAHAKFREGYALSELARAAAGTEPLQQAVEALASAERAYVESGSERDLASALHNQGVCLLELGDRTGDPNAYRNSAAIFVRATKSHLEVGNRENGAVTEYYRGVALLKYAALQDEHSAFRQSAEASATAASISEESPGGEEWHANARYNQGTAILELAKRTDRDADFQEAAAVLEEAARCLRSVEHTERGAEAEAARELALTTLRERVDTAKFDSATQSVAGLQGTTGSTGEKRTEEIPEGTDPPAALRSVREEFAGASSDELLEEIARLRQTSSSGLDDERSNAFDDASLDDLVATLEGGKSVPPAGLAQRLGELIRVVQQEPTQARDLEEKRELARKANLLLDGYSLRFELSDGSLARLRVTPYKEVGTFQFGLTRGSRGFRKEELVGVRRIIIQNHELRLSADI